jgi:hypothetical protein
MAWHGPLGPALADIFDALTERVRFAADSPVKEEGFEPSVPAR